MNIFKRNPCLVWEEVISLPKKMKGKEILEARKKLENSHWKVSLLPYKNGLSISDNKLGVRYAFDLSQSAGSTIGPLQQAVLVGDFGEPPKMIPIGPAIEWTHLCEQDFNEIHIIFFNSKPEYEKRIYGRFPSELAMLLFT